MVNFNSFSPKNHLWMATLTEELFKFPAESPKTFEKFYV